MKVVSFGKKIYIVFFILIILVICIITFIIVKTNEVHTDDIIPKKYHFICMFSGDNEQFIYNLKEGIEEGMENYDVWVTYETFSSGDLEGHCECFDKAIEAQVDGIITNVPSTKEIGRLIDKAALKKIPVITIVNDINGSQRKAFIGIDYKTCGWRAAEILTDGGNRVSRTVLVVPASSEDDLESRQKVLGVYEYEQQNGGIMLYKMNITQNYYPNAYATFENVFSSNMVCDSIIGLNDTITTAAIHYVKDHPEKKIRILGMGNSNRLFEALDNGYVDVILTEDARYVGKTAVEYLIRHKNGEKIPRKVFTDIYEVDAGNVHNYIGVSNYEPD